MLGAAPIPMSLSEVYTSIQTGVVQGQENDIALTLSLKFYEVAPYCVMTDHVAYEGSFYFNEEEYQSYPDELKQIIQEAGEEIKLKSRSIIKEQETECMKQIEDMGVTICGRIWRSLRRQRPLCMMSMICARPSLNLWIKQGMNRNQVYRVRKLAGSIFNKKQ